MRAIPGHLHDITVGGRVHRALDFRSEYAGEDLARALHPGKAGGDDLHRADIGPCILGPRGVGDVDRERIGWICGIDGRAARIEWQIRRLVGSA